MCKHEFSAPESEFERDHERILWTINHEVSDMFNKYLVIKALQCTLERLSEASHVKLRPFQFLTCVVIYMKRMGGGIESRATQMGQGDQMYTGNLAGHLCMSLTGGFTLIGCEACVTENSGSPKPPVFDLSLLLLPLLFRLFCFYFLSFCTIYFDCFCLL